MPLPQLGQKRPRHADGTGEDRREEGREQSIVHNISLRRELFARLKMRKSPELTFVADNSIERSAEISRKLSRLNAESEED